MPAAPSPAVAALLRAKVEHTLHPYHHDPGTTAFGDEVVTALGWDPERVFKTLVASVDGALVVGIVPVAAQLDLKALASAVGGKKAQLAKVPTPNVRPATSPAGFPRWGSANRSGPSSTPAPSSFPPSWSARGSADCRSNSRPRIWSPSARPWSPTSPRDDGPRLFADRACSPTAPARTSDDHCGSGELERPATWVLTGPARRHRLGIGAVRSASALPRAQSAASPAR